MDVCGPIYLLVDNMVRTETWSVVSEQAGGQNEFCPCLGSPGSWPLWSCVHEAVLPAASRTVCNEVTLSIQSRCEVMSEQKLASTITASNPASAASTVR